MKSISMGGDHSCLLYNNKLLACWGRNESGQVGNNGSSHVSSPTIVLDNVTKFNAGMILLVPLLITELLIVGEEII